MNNPKNASKKIDKFVEHYVIENFENIMGDRFGRYSKYIIHDVFKIFNYIMFNKF